MKICYFLSLNVISLLHLVNYDPEQNIWNKIEKFNKTGQGKKSLISTFTYLFIAIAKV